MDGEEKGLKKKERMKIESESEKIEREIGGIKEMGQVKEMMLIIEKNKEEIEIKEEKRIGIKVVEVIEQK